MDEFAPDPWMTWTLCSLRLQGIEIPAPQIARVARTLARLAPLAQRLVHEEAAPPASVASATCAA
ncbi:MAG TPA: hypothetical protein VMS38_04905 [Pseudorhodoferax sp.]|nr:hypothetical protein [Pseudorhodoferax sp.]